MVTSYQAMSSANRARRSPRNWRLDYGDRSLDFVNSKWNRLKDQRETLCSADDLMAWLRSKRLIDPRAARRWGIRLARSAAVRATVFRTAIDFREALYRLFRSIAVGEPSDRRDLAFVNRILAASLGRPVLLTTRLRRLQLVYRPEEKPVPALLGPIALAAARLLAEGEPSRFHPCLNPRCGVVFFDRTRNRSRRWCHMLVCGSVLKMRRYRDRSRGARRADR